MCLPMDVEPTKQTPLMSGCRRRISASFREQVTRLMTPLGSPASSHSSMMRIADWGTKLASFSTRVLPVAMQMGATQPMGSMAGKFQGTMPAKTPSGSMYCAVS